MKKRFLKKYQNAAGALPDLSTLNGIEVAPVDAIDAAVHDLRAEMLELKYLEEQEKLTEALYEARLKEMLEANKNGAVSSDALKNIDWNYVLYGGYEPMGIKVRTFDGYPGLMLLTNKNGKELLLSIGNTGDIRKAVSEFAVDGNYLSTDPNNAQLIGDYRTETEKANDYREGKLQLDIKDYLERESRGQQAANYLMGTAGLVMLQGVPYIGPALDYAFLGNGAYGLATLESPIGFNLETAFNVMLMLPGTGRIMGKVAAIPLVAPYVRLGRMRASHAGRWVGDLMGNAGRYIKTKTGDVIDVLNVRKHQKAYLSLEQLMDLLNVLISKMDDYIRAAESAADASKESHIASVGDAATKTAKLQAVDEANAAAARYLAHKPKSINLEQASPADIENALKTAQAKDKSYLFGGTPKDLEFKVKPDKTVVVTNTAGDAVKSGTKAGSDGEYIAVDITTGEKVPVTIENSSLIDGNVTEYPLVSDAFETRYGAGVAKLENGVSVNTKSPSISLEAVDVAQKKVKYVEEQIQGFKASGSTKSVSEESLVAAPSDVDGYMTSSDFNRYCKSHQVGVRVEGETYVVDLGVESPYLHLGEVEINILSVDRNGIGNARAEEVYRQFFPKEYLQQVAKQAAKGASTSSVEHVRILDSEGHVITERLLLDAIDPVQKSIMDSMEADWTLPKKDKFFTRIYNYLLGNNSELMHNALEKVARMELGEHGSLLPELKLGTVEENAELLESVGYPSSIALRIAAKGDAYVKNAMDYWYLSDCTAYRATNVGASFSENGSPETIIRNLTEYNPTQSKGGQLSGLGINTTTRGHSGAGAQIHGRMQPKIIGMESGMPAKDAVGLIKRQLFSEGLLTSEEASYINGIAGTTFQEGDSLKDVLNKLTSAIGSRKDRAILYNDILQHLKIRGLSGDPYGKGIYFGMGNLNSEVDAVGTMEGVAFTQPYYGIQSLRSRVAGGTSVSGGFNPSIYLEDVTRPGKYVPNPLLDEYNAIIEARKAKQVEAVEKFNALGDQAMEELDMIDKGKLIWTLGGMGGATLTGIGLLGKDVYDEYYKETGSSWAHAKDDYDESREFSNSVQLKWYQKQVEELSKKYLGKELQDKINLAWQECNKDFDEQNNDKPLYKEFIKSLKNGGSLNTKRNLFYKNVLKNLRNR